MAQVPSSGPVQRSRHSLPQALHASSLLLALAEFPLVLHRCDLLGYRVLVQAAKPAVWTLSCRVAARLALHQATRSEVSDITCFT